MDVVVVLLFIERALSHHQPHIYIHKHNVQRPQRREDGRGRLGSGEPGSRGEPGEPPLLFRGSSSISRINNLN